VSAASLILGIETSCDDTSVAVLEEGRRLRAHLIASQDLHRLYGGVVPELAARAHLELLPRLVVQALAEAEIRPADLTAVAVTRAPGLVGSLVVGVAFAKAYAYALGIPVVGVNHIEAHLHAASLEHGEASLPALSLVVSGGHTELVEVNGFGRYRWLGSTRDDAVGEAYDKVAKRLGLPFPGGPHVDRLAAEGNPAAYDFPRPMLDRPGYDFSFSGLKTAVALEAEALGEPPYDPQRVADLCASFQAAVIDTLAGKTLRAAEEIGARSLTLGGGVACNRALRARLTLECEGRGIALRIPSPRLCADNAAMVALVGAWSLAAGPPSEEGLEVVASLEETGLSGVPIEAPTPLRASR
jgi:N6-L-threonylcarbamoyladenine synthase